MPATAFDWLTPLADRGPVPGLERPLAVTFVVAKTADGDLRFTATFGAGSGADEGAADEVELTAVPAVAEDLASGVVTPNVAWMSGRLKAAGPTGPLLALLAMADSAAAG